MNGPVVNISNCLSSAKMCHVRTKHMLTIVTIITAAS